MLHPVAAVHIDKTIFKNANFWSVDMTTNDPVVPFLTSMLNEHLVEMVSRGEETLCEPLELRRKVNLALSLLVHAIIDGLRVLVEPGAHPCDLRVFGAAAIKEVAMNDQQIPSVRSAMTEGMSKLDEPEFKAVHAAHERVVIARRVTNLRSVLGFAEDGANDVGVLLLPLPLASYPAVDDVANQKEMVAIHRVEKVLNGGGFASDGAQVDVRQKDRPVVGRLSGFPPIFIDVGTGSEEAGKLRKVVQLLRGVG